MGQVSVKVNGRDYDISCDDGQEKHVVKLADQLERRINAIVGASPRREGDTLVLVMAAILAIDELQDAQNDLKRLKSANVGSDKDVDAVAAGLTTLAKRIESIAERLDAT